MDTQLPGWLTGPKSPAVSANDLVVFDSAEGSVQAPSIVTCSSKVVSCRVINEDFTHVPASRWPAMIHHPKSEFAPATGIGIVRTHQLLFGNNSNSGFLQSETQPIRFLRYRKRRCSPTRDRFGWNVFDREVRDADRLAIFVLLVHAKIKFW